MKTKLLALLSLMAMSAFSATWPDGPIKLVVPYTPGGITDELARSVGEPLSAELRVPVVYDYKPGGSGIVGANFVAKSRPDGNTLVIVSNSFATSTLTSRVPYNAADDFEPVSLLTMTPAVVVVQKDLPVENFNDLIKFAKENPRKVNYATSGIGSLTHLTMEKAQQQGNFKVTHIPYKGQSEIWADFLGGHLDALIDTPAGITKYANNKKVKILALTARNRLGSLPDVPTIAESKLKDFSAYGGFLILAPKGTPEDIVNNLSTKLSAIVNSTAFRSKFEFNGMVSIGSTAKEAKDFLSSEFKMWQEVVNQIR
jgi:tripartite-type tricarboxylate transporter receptor subunit TctC